MGWAGQGLWTFYFIKSIQQSCEVDGIILILQSKTFSNYVICSRTSKLPNESSFFSANSFTHSVSDTLVILLVNDTEKEKCNSWVERGRWEHQQLLRWGYKTKFGEAEGVHLGGDTESKSWRRDESLLGGHEGEEGIPRRSSRAEALNIIMLSKIVICLLWEGCKDK